MKLIQNVIIFIQQYNIFLIIYCKLSQIIFFYR